MQVDYNNEVEVEGLKAYHNDPYTEEELESFGDSELYEGGSNSDRQSFMSKICCFGSKTTYSKKDTEKGNGFESMSSEERKAHIDLLW